MKAIKSLIYTSPFSHKEVRVVACSDSLWMTQLQMSRLFGCDVRNVHIILKALFASGELDKNLVNRPVEIQNFEGRYVSGNFYNLDAVIAVGYRIDPKEATHFHIWSTAILRNEIFRMPQSGQKSLLQTIRQKVSHMLAVA